MLCERCASELTAESAYCLYCGARIEGVPEHDDYAYEAFISYRHLPKDREVALKVQRALEGARIPKELRDKYPRARLGKLFRDEDELPTAASLPDMIVDALRRSRYLIVVCTPQTRESAWVLREISTFAALHGRDRILIALADGEPNESFPPLLLNRMERDPKTGQMQEVPAEPLAADFRPSNRKRFGNEVMRLEASILGCGYDDLRQRLHARRMRVTVAISAVIAAVSLAFGSFALYQQAQIQLNYQRSLINESKLMARESQGLLADGDRISAISISLQALPGSNAGGDRPFVSAAQLSLERAVGIFPQSNAWENLYAAEDASGICDSRDGLLCIGILDNTIEVLDMTTGALKAYYSVRTSLPGTDIERSSLSAVKLGASTVACIYGEYIVCFDLETNSCLWSAGLPSVHEGCNLLYLEDADQFAVFVHPPSIDENVVGAGEPKLVFLDAQSGWQTQVVTLPQLAHASTACLVAAKNQTAFAIAEGNQVVLFERGTQMYQVAKAVVSDLAQPFERDVEFAGDAVVVASCSTEDDSFQMASIECFEANLERTWLTEIPVVTQYGEHATTLPSAAEIVGCAVQDDQAGAQLALTVGRQLLFLDLDDGSETYSEMLPTPIVGSYALSGGDGQLVVVGATAGGDLFMRSPWMDTALEDSLFNTNVGLVNEAHLLVGAGGPLGFALWSDNPARFRVYAPLGIMFRDDVWQATEVSGTVQWDGNHLLTQSDTSITLIDPNSFQKTWSVEEPSLGLDASEGLTRVMGEQTLLVCSTYATSDFSEGLQFVELSYDDGSVVNRGEISFASTITPFNELVHFDIYDDGSTSLLGYASQNRAVVYDRKAHQVVSTIAPTDASFTISGMWLSRDTVAIYQQRGASGTFGLYDQQTGEELDCDLSGQAVDEQRGSRIVSLSPDRSTLVFKGYDGKIQAYSMSDGALLWDDTLTTTNAQFVSFVSKDRILVQSAAGTCDLLAASNGELVGDSDVELPILSSCDKPADHGVVPIRYEIGGAYELGGLVVFTLDESSFGPISDAPFGFFLSEDGNKVLSRVPWRVGFAVYPRYSLDELIEKGNQVVGTYLGLQ